MIKLIYFLIPVFFILSTADAQVLQPPKGTPGKPSLPTPSIKPLLPADLEVVSVQLIGAETRTDTKSVFVSVNVTVKNNGQVTAATSKITGSFQKTGTSNPWKNFDNMVNLPSVNGGQTVTQLCVFKIPAATLGVTHFSFRVLLDATGVVHESNENNNSSQGILIAL